MDAWILSFGTVLHCTRNRLERVLNFPGEKEGEGKKAPFIHIGVVAWHHIGWYEVDQYSYSYFFTFLY